MLGHLHVRRGVDMYAPNLTEQLAAIRSRAQAWERQLKEIESKIAEEQSEAKIAELEGQRAQIKERLALANQALSRFQSNKARS
jgi:predicted  nucleic acid-binding Zn-ribbon protein